MTDLGPDDRAPGSSPRRGRRGAPASDDALRTLGHQIDGTGAGGVAVGDDVPPVANEAGLVALGQEIDRATPRSARRRSGARRRHPVRRALAIALAVVLVLVAGGAGYLYYITHDLHRVTVLGLKGTLTSGQEAGAENILMVGSTSRCALTVQNPAYGLCSQGVNGVNSDVIMILHANPANHTLALLSVPRDLFVPNARADGANKVDAGLVEGMSQVVAAVEDDFGISIQHAVSLNFDQFANIVDALGGINLSFPESVFDAESGLNVQAATCVHLNGTQALAVVRARHLQYDAPGTTSNYAEEWPQENLSDLARIRRDHEFLRVLAGAVAKSNLSDPLSDLNLINSVKADLTFDQSWAVSDMASLVLAFHSVNINAVPQLTLPVSVVVDPDGSGGGLVYQGSNYGDVEFPAETQDQAAIDQVLGIGPNTDSMTGTALPAAADVTVSVENGTGAYEQATTTGTALSALGFKVLSEGDVTPTGDVSETVVYYGSKSPSTEAAAEKVARSMSGAVIMAYAPSQVVGGATVTVVTGTQFAVNPPTPAAPATSSTATGNSAATTSSVPVTTTTTTSSGSSAIEAASPATSGLEPWDPRGCPVGAPVTAPVANLTF